MYWPMHVGLKGLKARPELNGCCCLALRVDLKTGRLAVRLAAGTHISVKTANIDLEPTKLLNTLQQAVMAEASGEHVEMGAMLEQLRCGVELGGGLGRSGAAEVTLLGHGKGSTRLLLTIREGKNRQVRRMLHAVGSAVVRLERESIGTLGLGSLGSEEGGGDTQPAAPCQRPRGQHHQPAHQRPQA